MEPTTSTQQKWYITYGGPSYNYNNAVRRICSEAGDFNVFDRIIGYTEKDLMNDATFWNKHQPFIEANANRGYGYWIWKSYLTLKTLEQMNDNDILVYTDAGCILNKEGKSRLLEYFDILNKNELGNISFQMDHLDKTFTKMDILQFYDANEPNILETGQLVGGVYVLRKCQHTIELINKWYEGCCHYHLVDDSPSKLKNIPSFIANRNDQSIFSVLRKKYGTISLSDETWFSPEWNVTGKNYPFWAIRKRE
jgi:hypothetical protein